MNNALILGSLISGAVVTAGATGVLYKAEQQPRFAEVVAVQEVTETYQVPRSECRDEIVTQQAAPKDPNRIAGTAVGAVLGGVIGNQMGGGNGKKLMTVVGAAAGGLAGRQVQGQMQTNNTVQATEQRCQTVYDTRERVTGYDVSYTIEGEPGSVRLNDRPGDRIPVRDGELVLDSERGSADSSDSVDA